MWIYLKSNWVSSILKMPGSRGSPCTMTTPFQPKRNLDHTSTEPDHDIFFVRYCINFQLRAGTPSWRVNGAWCNIFVFQQYRVYNTINTLLYQAYTARFTSLQLSRVPEKSTYREVSYAKVTFLKNVAQIEHKIPI